MCYTVYRPRDFFSGFGGVKEDTVWEARTPRVEKGPTFL